MSFKDFSTAQKPTDQKPADKPKETAATGAPALQADETAKQADPKAS